MTKTLIYLDQNIIDPSVKISFESKGNLELVYSKEHFQEISRSDDPSQYLDVLKSLNAKLLDVELDDHFQFTGNAILQEEGTPKQHFENYLDAISDVNVDGAIFDPFQAWLNGGGGEGEKQLKEFPNQLLEQFKKTIEILPEDQQVYLMNDFNDSHEGLRDTIEKMIYQGNNLKKNREAIGNGKGELGNIIGENQIEKIWEIIKLKINGITCNQFFGFESLPINTDINITTHQSIIACCNVFDIIGFQAEKKSRKIDQIPNIRSDAEHIAMASFCSVLISTDERLVKRAKAIYDYKKISTTPKLITK